MIDTFNMGGTSVFFSLSPRVESILFAVFLILFWYVLMGDIVPTRPAVSQPALTPVLICPRDLGEVYLDSCFDNNGMENLSKIRQIYSVPLLKKDLRARASIYAFTGLSNRTHGL
jgi:hypothetical protein